MDMGNVEYKEDTFGDDALKRFDAGLGVGGAVVLGDLWNRFDACQDQNYLAVIEHFKKLKKLSD